MRAMSAHYDIITRLGVCPFMKLARLQLRAFDFMAWREEALGWWYSPFILLPYIIHSASFQPRWFARALEGQ